MTADERSDLAGLVVQTLGRLRSIAKKLEAAGHPQSDVDREIRENVAIRLGARRAGVPTARDDKRRNHALALK